MKKINEFKRRYPRQMEFIKGKEFPYRYYKNDHSDKTVVLLGDGGLGDVLFLHFEEFAKSYSVLAFDYLMDYKTIQELVDGIVELLNKKGIRGILIGQALGGFIAQIIARQYPDMVEGLILYNTGTLSVNLNQQGRQFFQNMLEHTEKMLQMMKLIPFRLLKQGIKKAAFNESFSQSEKVVAMEICDEMLHALTKEFQMHILSLSIDLQNHWNMTQDDFICFRGGVLLMLSDKDTIYDDNMRQALIELMPDPKVVTEIQEKQFDLMVRTEQYIKCVKGFIDSYSLT